VAICRLLDQVVEDYRRRLLRRNQAEDHPPPLTPTRGQARGEGRERWRGASGRLNILRPYPTQRRGGRLAGLREEQRQSTLYSWRLGPGQSAHDVLMACRNPPGRVRSGRPLR
jgi:hypothetical protein